MTPREQQTSGGLPTAIADLPKDTTENPSDSLAALMNALPTPQRTWEKLLGSLSRPQQTYILRLAYEQGLLTEPPEQDRISASHELGPDVSIGTDPLRVQILGHLLHGKTDHLEPPRTLSLRWGKQPLDQVLSVVQAPQTPDVYFIQSLSSEVRAGRAAEIIYKLVQAGERVLLLGPTPPGVDRILAHVDTLEGVSVVRCQEPNERSLRPSVEQLTLEGRCQNFSNGALASARQALAEAEKRIKERKDEGRIWDELADVLAWRVDLSDKIESLEQRLKDVPMEVDLVFAERAEASGQDKDNTASSSTKASKKKQPTGTKEPVTAEKKSQSKAEKATEVVLNKLDYVRKKHNDKKKDLEEQREALHAEIQERAAALEEATNQIQDLQPLEAAKQQNSFLSWSYWRAMGKRQALDNLDELRAQRGEIENHLKKLRTRADKLESEDQELEDNLAEQVAKFRQQEIENRTEQLRQELMTAKTTRDVTDQKWEQTIRQLPNDVTMPDEPNEEALQSAKQEWERLVGTWEEKAARLTRWLEYLDQGVEDLARDIFLMANVVAATTKSLPEDEHFGELASELGTFDTLVLDDAAGVTESELMVVAQRSQRWILLGDSAHSERRGRTGGTRVNGKHGGRSRTPPPPPRGEWFHEVWKVLHCDPSRSPYRWTRREDRLHCRLRYVPGHLLRESEFESVEDRPDIELRIVELPEEGPALAEVTFPANTDIVEALAFIVQELDELPLQTLAHNMYWEESKSKVILRLLHNTRRKWTPFELEEGLIVQLAQPNERHRMAVMDVLNLEFDCEKGWTLEKAQEWVAGKLSWRVFGRTAYIDG